jgi:cyclophilin family peptidyl-prolyl cis-trans isomerase
MKKILLSLALFAAGLVAGRAEDVALITFRIGKDKTPRQVALEFYEGDAPKTVENFKKLAGKGFYKGLAIHRAFPGTLVQMGDPLTDSDDRTGVGTGGPGYTLAPEIRRKHTKGAVAAARLPDKINPTRVSNGSQFYVCLTPIPSYDGQYTVFGNVVWGLETLEEISNLPVDSNDYPVTRVEIKSLKVLPREKLPAQPAAAKPAPAAKKPWWKLF